MTTVYCSKTMHRQLRTLAGAWNLTTSAVISRLIMENDKACSIVEEIEV